MDPELPKTNNECYTFPRDVRQPRTVWQVVDCVWNVRAHAQKPDLVFRRNGRVHLNRPGRQFSRLLAAEVCASAVVLAVMLDTPRSEVVWRVLAIHSIRQFPLHFPSRASPCAFTFQLDSIPTFRRKVLPPSLRQKSWTWANNRKISKERVGDGTPNEPTGARDNCLILHLNGMQWRTGGGCSNPPHPEIPKISVESSMAQARRTGVSISFYSSLCSHTVVIY